MGVPASGEGECGRMRSVESERGSVGGCGASKARRGPEISKLERLNEEGKGRVSVVDPAPSIMVENP